MVSEMQFEIDGSSIEEIKNIAKTKIPAGYKILSEEILEPGGEKIAQGTGDTVVAAFERAKEMIPPQANVRERRTTRSPDRVIEIAAFNENEVKTIAKEKMDSDDSITNIHLKVEGKRGFIGIGRTPNIYEANFTRQAAVEIVYDSKPRIRFILGRLPSKTELLESLAKLAVMVETARVRYPALRAEFRATAVVALGKTQRSIVWPEFNSLLGDAKLVFPYDVAVQALQPLNEDNTFSIEGPLTMECDAVRHLIEAVGFTK